MVPVHSKGASLPVSGPSENEFSTNHSMYDRRTVNVSAKCVPILLTTSASPMSSSSSSNSASSNIRLQNIGLVAATAFSRSTMSLHLRRLVSKKKKRFQEGDLDLDLSYIIDNRLIAMGYPAEKLEGCYRNRMDEVIKFFQRHQNNYKVYNLCSERSYSSDKFENRVECFPFDDHNPPEFPQIFRFCSSVKAWLDEKEEHVAAVHCKAGKGRTGLMVCAYLMQEFNWDAVKAMSFYADKRTSNSKGVTIPSQRRYIYYYEYALKRGLLPTYQPTPLRLYQIEIRGVPYIGTGNTLGVSFSIYEGAKELFSSDCHQLKRHSDVNNLKIIPPLKVKGDIKIVIHHRSRLKGKKSSLFQLWVNTFFICHGSVGSDSNRSLHPEAGSYQEIMIPEQLPLMNYNATIRSLPMGISQRSEKVIDSSLQRKIESRRGSQNQQLVPPPSASSSNQTSPHRLFHLNHPPPMTSSLQKSYISSPFNAPANNNGTTCKATATVNSSKNMPSQAAGVILDEQPYLISANIHMKSHSATLGSSNVYTFTPRHFYRVSFNKSQLDGTPRKDVSHRSYPETFKITLYFACEGCSQCLPPYSLPMSKTPTSVTRVNALIPCVPQGAISEKVSIRSKNMSSKESGKSQSKAVRRTQTSSPKLRSPVTEYPMKVNHEIDLMQSVEIRKEPQQRYPRKRRSSLELALTQDYIMEEMSREGSKYGTISTSRPSSKYQYTGSELSLSTASSLSEDKEEDTEFHMRSGRHITRTMLRIGSDSIAEHRLALLWSRMNNSLPLEFHAADTSDGGSIQRTSTSFSSVRRLSTPVSPHVQLMQEKCRQNSSQTIYRRSVSLEVLQASPTVPEACSNSEILHPEKNVPTFTTLSSSSSSFSCRSHSSSTISSMTSCHEFHHTYPSSA